MSRDITIYELGNARATFTSRHGGCSMQPYDSLNLGTHVGDNAGDVLRNRELAHKAIEQRCDIAPHSSWSFLNQTHEDNIVCIDERTVLDNEYPPTADASVTAQRNQPLVVMTADCGPLVIATKSVVSVVHASWKTVAAGIIDSVVEEISARAPGEKMYGLLGPCIHPENYEFEDDLLDALVAKLGKHVASQTREGKTAFDLPAAIKHECESRDIAFTDIGIDTFDSPDYFSYRRDGVTGRQGVIAWLK